MGSARSVIAAHLELGGILYAVQVHSALVGEVIEHIAGSLCFLAPLLEPATCTNSLCAWPQSRMADMSHELGPMGGGHMRVNVCSDHVYMDHSLLDMRVCETCFTLAVYCYCNHISCLPKIKLIIALP